MDGSVQTIRRLLIFLVVNFSIAGVGLHYATVYLYRHHYVPSYCSGTVIHPLHDMLSRYQEHDSWLPMFDALDARHSPRGIYETVFFERHIKFQYPLFSLVPLELIRKAGVQNARTFDILKWLSILAFLAQIPLIFVVLSRAFHKRQNPWLMWALASMMVISFYPLSKAYSLGQIQIFLDVLFSTAFISWIGNKETLSGCLVGLGALVKPQYGLFLLWALIRRYWRFFASALTTLLAGTVLGVLFYGWKNNIQYLSVISYMSRHGEAFYPNQSANGLLNRLMQNGNNTTFVLSEFAPFLPVVYWLTLASSIAIIAFAILNKKPTTETGRIAEFGLVSIAAIAASPIAWEHHYGTLLPLFAWALPRARAKGVLLASFVLCADDFRITNVLAGMSPWNVLQSTLYIGAIIFFLHLRRIARLSGNAGSQEMPA